VREEQTAAAITATATMDKSDRGVWLRQTASCRLDRTQRPEAFSESAARTDAALVPEVVEAARQFQRRLRADIALEDLAVIADRLDLAIGPFLVQSQQLAGVWSPRMRWIGGSVLDFI
jgi:hypothetical protein